VLIQLALERFGYVLAVLQKVRQFVPADDVPEACLGGEPVAGGDA
jgi:hypothetical protein